MKYNELINRVSDRPGVSDRATAEHATTATLSVLGERLAGNEPADLAAQLPEELGALLTHHVGESEKYDWNEFLQRVADRYGDACTVEQAETYARGVMSTISSFVSTGELDDLRSQLPPDYAPLLT